MAILHDSKVSPWSKWVQTGISGYLSTAASMSFLRYTKSEYLRAPLDAYKITGAFMILAAFMIP